MKDSMRRRLLMTFAILTTTWLCACGPKMIEGTQIEATDLNMEIYQVIQQYRRAMEERDVVALNAVISREYFDNQATTDTNQDDYGYDKLKEQMMPVLRDNIKKVRMDLRLMEIGVQGERAHASFEYVARFLFTEGGKDGWITKNDFNRLELVKEDGNWRIISGL